MELSGRRLSFAASLVMGLLLQSPAHAQSQTCEGFFQTYSKTEIVDALVNIREAWMSIAGVQAKQEMLGKADDIYITPATVCRDLALAQVDPSVLTEALKKQRSDREEATRVSTEYRQQMLAKIAEAPAVPFEGATIEPGEIQRVAAKE